MKRVRFTTTLQEELLKKAKDKAQVEGLDGANELIEKALRLYFANEGVEVWEKVEGDTLKKLVKKSGKVIFQKIKSRKLLADGEKYTTEALRSHGFNHVWSINPNLRLI